jgi:molybdenum cofactor cytidylyltransferase
MEQLAILILAAGSSERLGQPKQLLPYTDKNMLHHVASEALKITKNVVVVLGSNAEIIQEEIKDLRVQFLYNKDWKEGMSSSIRNGLSFLLKEELLIDVLIIMVSDQPFVSQSLLNEMIIKYKESKKPIIACAYKDTVGVPVLFDSTFFNDLLALQGQSGAKKIIAQNRSSTETIPFPMGYVDIDTKEDYEAFKKIHSSN